MKLPNISKGDKTTPWIEEKSENIVLELKEDIFNRDEQSRCLMAMRGQMK